MASQHLMRTAAWYGDLDLDLALPPDWDVTVHWPDTPPPLTDDQLREALESPLGQPPIRELARGRRRPLLIVDDLTRPTPVARVMPHVLGQLRTAGIPPEQVSILVATGMHGSPGRAEIVRKVGREAAEACGLVVHDPVRNLERVGRTSLGTPVIVAREVAQSDLLIGISGVYPQNTAGFGGGSKLLIGVSGKRSVIGLHYRHAGARGFYDIENSFRRDLDEMARMVGLDTMVSLQVNGRREIVRAVSGDHHRYYREAVRFGKEAFAAPLPEGADLVISNSYPIDVSLTMARVKGIVPLQYAPRSASRILIAACPEGAGQHGLFPYVNPPRFQRLRHLARRLLVKTPSELGRSVLGRVAPRLRRAPAPAGGEAGRTRHVARTTDPAHPVWLLRPGEHARHLPPSLPGLRMLAGWEEALRVVEREQGGRPLKVAVYPCAPLLCLDLKARGADD